MKHDNLIATTWLCLCLLAVMASCQHEDPCLRSIYAYIDSNQLDSAKLCLDKVDLKSLDEANRALYYLVETKLDYVNYVPIANDHLIRRSVAYYEKTKNDLLLAESLFYQSMIEYDNGETRRAFRLLKRAETVVGKCRDGLVKHKIVEALATNNMEEGEFEMALRYAKQTLSLSERLKDPNRIGYANAYLSEIYGFMNRKDSAYYYMKKYLAYIDYIPMPERANFYNYVATMYFDSDKKMAEEYALRGYRLKRTCVNCCVLAQLCHERGDSIAAEKYLSQALPLATSTRDSVYVLANKVSIYKDRHDYQEALSCYGQLYAVHKRLDHSIQENDAKTIQIGYDAEMDGLRQRQIFFCILAGVLFLVLLFLLLWLYRRYRFNEMCRKVMENELLIRTYQTKVETMGLVQRKERAQYTRELSKLQECQAEMLSKGRSLYEHVMAGGTIVKWGKDDMARFMEYFKLLDLSFVKRLENDYDHLSLRYGFYLVMRHVGKSDEEIQRIMGINYSSVRSIKSRVKSKYIGS